jgi:hypothetical protein
VGFANSFVAVDFALYFLQSSEFEQKNLLVNGADVSQGLELIANGSELQVATVDINRLTTSFN